MPIEMATRTREAVFVVIVMASHWTCLHARSMPGDYDTHEFVPTTGAYEDFDSRRVTPSFATQTDLPSFASEESFATESDTTTATTWAAHSFTTHDSPVADSGSTDQSTYNYQSLATTDADLPFDTFVDSPETVTGQDTTTTSLADDAAVRADGGTHSHAEYENDEVFFDTTHAGTVYRADDE